MKLFCPDCGVAIPAADMDLSTSTAKCVACNAVFAFDAAASETRAPSRNAPRPALPRPAGINVDESTGAWVATYRWFTPAYVFLAFFCVAWDSFLIFWYSMAFKHNAPWIMVIFPVVHLAVGIGLTYATLSGFLNTTRITVDGQSLAISHGPLPWTGVRTLVASDIRQLFCERTFSRNVSTNVNMHHNTATTFALSAVLGDGSKLKLLRGFSEPDRPLFLEQEIERRLRIQPAAVAGEYQP